MQKYNIWRDKLNIGIAIYEIGIRRKITLEFDDSGGYTFSGGGAVYSPEDQPLPKGKIYKTSITVESDEGDWAQYAAEELLWQIEKQM